MTIISWSSFPSPFPSLVIITFLTLKIFENPRLLRLLVFPPNISLLPSRLPSHPSPRFPPKYQFPLPRLPPSPPSASLPCPSRVRPPAPILPKREMTRSLKRCPRKLFLRLRLPRLKPVSRSLLKINALKYRDYFEYFWEGSVRSYQFNAKLNALSWFPLA